MIISHKHKFVFIHNPKVAGSAIRQVLQHLHDDDINFWHQGFLPELDRVVDLAHLTWRDLLLVRPEVENYEVMVVMRDPYARFVSAVEECVRQHSIYLGNSGNLDEWIVEHFDESNFRWNWKYIHLCPQHYFVPPTGTTWLLKHETLSEEWPSFQEQMATKGVTIADLPQGVRVRPDIPGRLKADNLTEFALSVINIFYSKDFQLGYEKRGSPNKIVSGALDHHERVNCIHSPYLPAPDFMTLTPGEQIAWTERYGPPHCQNAE